ncbi:hypothetical protein DFP72DRAFT_1108058 [Ephemerocybe angulata]|uniref:F-box domain-containing protein n=1 Tax=Ephemerocybe angulata TaxID=980116 RepID=A0A8H6II67_9AGAR|nr:hypothetical protein DFP72DRAFT_1108058 [Tulosesus angulatus]
MSELVDFNEGCAKSPVDGLNPMEPESSLERPSGQDIVPLEASTVIPTVPMELWQRVFTLATRDVGEEAYHKTLFSFRNVSRFWNNAALGECHLWCRLPRIILSNSLSDEDYAAIKQRLILCLERGGSLPISFTFDYQRREEPISLSFDNQYYRHRKEEDLREAFKALEILTGVSDRWEDVNFLIPDDLLVALAPVRGRLASLSRMSYQRRLSLIPCPWGRKTGVSCFVDAPKLKEVTIDTLTVCFPDRDDGASVMFDLPWKQLEVVNAIVCQEDSYMAIINNSGRWLRSLKYQSIQVTTFSSTMINIQSLSTLCLWSEGPPRLLCAHLQCLTLPALEDLDIGGLFETNYDLYPSILLLLRHSNCSLRKLAVDRTSDVSEQLESFVEILALSPRLTHLDIGHLDAFVWSRLELSPSNQLVPELQMITLRGRLAGDLTRNLLPDPFPFMNMVHTRTDGGRPHSHQQDGTVPLIRRLREVRLVGDDRRSRSDQARLYEASERWLRDGRFDIDLSKMIAKWEPSLREDFYPLRQHSTRFQNVHLRLGMNQVMLELEGLDVRDRDTRMLIRLGVIHFLHAISQRPEGCIPGDDIYNFRTRALQLCQKWKLYLLQDFRSSPYRWSYLEDGLFRLQYIDPSSARSEDEDWVDILGCNNQEALGISRGVGPWFW